MGCMGAKRMNSKTKKILIACTAAVAVVGVIGLAQLSNRLGYKSGWQDAMVAVKVAVQASQYPVVDITYPGKQAVSITVGDVCKPYPSHLPAFYHAVIVSPYYQPCGQPAHGQPYQDSAALAAITKEVQK